MIKLRCNAKKQPQNKSIDDQKTQIGEKITLLYKNVPKFVKYRHFFVNTHKILLLTEKKVLGS